MLRRILLSSALAVPMILLSVLVAPTASAATGTYLRLAHLSPDTPTVDVLVTSYSGQTLHLRGVNYGDVSSYTRIEPGSYTVQMRPAGADDSTPAVVSTTLDAREGAAYTAAGLGRNDDLAVRVLTDDLTPPGADRSRIRVVQGAEPAGAVSISWNGTTAMTAVPFGTATDYVTVPSGSGSFTVAPASGAPVQLPVDLASGDVYSVVLVQRDGTLTAELKTDARSSGEVPTGGIQTGYGGTAGLDGTRPVVAAGIGLSLLLGLVTAVGLRRGRRQDA